MPTFDVELTAQRTIRVTVSEDELHDDEDIEDFALEVAEEAFNSTAHIVSDSGYECGWIKPAG